MTLDLFFQSIRSEKWAALPAMLGWVQVVDGK
jgi:hypothetical protein